MTMGNFFQLNGTYHLFSGFPSNGPGICPYISAYRVASPAIGAISSESHDRGPLLGDPNLNSAFGIIAKFQIYGPQVTPS